MVELRVLGSPSLVGQEGHELRSVVHQPKRLLLLTYLTVMSYGGYVRRDKLLGLFWPTSTEKKARSSLSEALSRLRTSLGEGVIVTRGSDEVGIAADRVWCDVVEVQRAGEGHEWPVVADLYRGPLLDGLVPDGLTDVEQWLELTRARLARAALEALGKLADDAIAAGDDSAQTWTERAFQLDPLDGDAARRVMRVLANSGHRTAALTVFEDYEARLRSERGIPPSPETDDLVHRIRSAELEEAAGVERADEAVDASFAAPMAAHDRLPQPSAQAPTPGRWSPLTLGSVTVSAVLILFIVAAALSPPRAPTVLRYGLALPGGEALARRVLRPRIALSPDGSRLLYVGDSEDGDAQLWLRPRDQLSATRVPGTQRPSNPFFSPGGNRFGYLRGGSRFAPQALMVASLDGGAPSTLLSEGVGLAGASWGTDGNIYYDGLTGGGTTGVMRVASEGGPPEQITAVDTARGEIDHVWPHVLPEATALLFTILRRAGPTEADVAVVDLDTGQTRVLVRAVMAKYAESGHLVFVRADGTLAAVSFDADRLELRGEPVELADGVSWRLNGAVDLALSASGALAYVRGAQAPDPAELIWVDRNGNVEPVQPGWFADFSTLALSPDGSRIVVSALTATWSGVQDLFVKELPRGPLMKLAVDRPGRNFRPAWSPDGHSVTFLSDRAGQMDVYQRRADGSDQPRLLLDGAHAISDAFYSPDGEWLVYVENGDVFARREGRDPKTVTLVATPAVESFPAVSPDGRWLAYMSDESGRRDVYVSPFPNTSDFRRKVSTDGGTGPQWAHGGDELFYKTPGGDVAGVRVAPGEPFEIGRPEVVTSVRNPQRWASPRNLVVAPDDGRFLTLRRNQALGGGELIVNEGFFHLLREIAGG